MAWTRLTRPGRTVSVLLALLAFATPASAAPDLANPNDQWLPSADGASWTYSWSDSAYAPTPTREQYTLQSRVGSSFRLAWTTEGQENGEGTQQSAGTIDYKRENSGLINLNWSATPPPPQFPILCANASGCGNSVAGAHFMLIWGTRSPVLVEPLLQGAEWSTAGGANNDVSSTNRYLGLERVVVPAFPGGVIAAKVQSDVSQAGALGDPYGSGVRTTWWVRGVGPVKIGFRHAGGAVQEAVLEATTLVPTSPPPDTNYLPFKTGQSMVFGWHNNKYMKKTSKQRFTVSQVVNNTARVDVKQISGPIGVAGSYVFATRLDGVTNLQTFTKAATRARFPALGPRTLPAAKRRRFFTPFDLMAFGFNPVLPVYPTRGGTWTGTPMGADYRAYGVTGTTKVLGIRRIRTKIGSFKALVVQSKLEQKGFAFGSGTRTSWFAPGKGLVKLVFRHGDGSVSTVDRLR